MIRGIFRTLPKIYDGVFYLLEQKAPPQIFNRVLNTSPQFSHAGAFRGVLKRGVLNNFAKFTGKHLSQSLFFNRIAHLKPVTLLKKRLEHRCFPVNFCEIFQNNFFYGKSLVAASEFPVHWLQCFYYSMYLPTGT